MSEFEISFLDLSESAKLTPKERKKLEVQNKLAKILEAHPSGDLPQKVNKLAIFGSRSLSNVERVSKILDSYIEQFSPELLVTAKEPLGICFIAQKYAEARHIALQVHFLQVDKYARGCHEHRSDAVIKASDAVLFIHDGYSRGTYNEILRAIHFGKPYLYRVLQINENNEILCDV